MKSNSLKFILCLLAFVSTNATYDCFGQASKVDNSVEIIDGNVTYEAPMAYELMNIAMALTDKTIMAGQFNLYHEVIDTSTVYYKEVIAYFSPYKNHDLIQQINKAFRKGSNKYGTNMHFAYNTIWEDDRMTKNKQYPFFHTLYFRFNSISRKTFDDFAKTSNFETFYLNHKGAYVAILENSRQYADVNNQQKWLEGQFPERYEKFNIVISPLMNGTHFTKHFTYKGFKKCIMWVAKANIDNELPKEVQAGRYTGVVMTEIDHNYVNPISDLYKKQLNTLMGGENRAKWTKGSVGNSYKNGYKVFNEYMTHAVYLLYTNDKYKSGDQEVIEKARINLMENRRKFYKFGAFYDQLKHLYQSKNDKETVADLYPKIIEWCKTQNFSK